MSWSYLVSNDGHLVVERWEGDVAHDEVVRHEREQLRDRRIANGAVVFADLEAARFPGSDELNIHEIAAPHGEGEPVVITRIAIHAPDVDTFARARIFEREVDRHGPTTIVFGDFDTACIWLGVDPLEIRHQLERLRREVSSDDIVRSESARASCGGGRDGADDSG